MASHDVATDQVAPYIAAMTGNHPELAEAGVTFDALFAFGEDGAPAGVKHQGFPAPATIKVNGPTLRKRNLADATFVIEADEWRIRDEAGRMALIDHYLAYVVALRDVKGVIREDDAGRPKIRIGPPDYRLAGFRAVAERHGAASIEVNDAAGFRASYGELLLDPEPETAPA
jgi:hypothetical protein